MFIRRPRILSMNINKDKLYVCKKLDNNLYQEPKLIIANIMPTNQDGDIIAYGSSFPEYARIKQAITKELEEIKANDKVYYSKEPPIKHDATQASTKSANFIVSGMPTITKNTIDIRLKRIPNR